MAATFGSDHRAGGAAINDQERRFIIDPSPNEQMILLRANKRQRFELSILTNSRARGSLRRSGG
jgi:hypothetical protein